ncbi:MAG TPA: hypothetical protein VGG13_03890 [Candidatus Saccharimonadales bacterium]|jgi:antitoxin component of MazEF toxin-antitoxin module
MATITTKLVKDGNSMAVRLSKPVLAMSGLQGAIILEVKQGQIILSAPSADQQVGKPREGWEEQIKRVLAEEPKALDYDEEVDDWDATAADGLDEEH